ncbi:MAG: tRNA (adenosine(37)-N6)-threonylcarbamoyltransferase complex dimerization subunit type 1 TsaB [Candidatus Nitricoxidivorans perseverans]|uniref:tRNA (Adenosine(37)-N6)-threonylcarbamoyltransferase complex dimerization subunit type 1 TsaB n=1 Tax=Candidatus Nitricoxidivorans perseverans TaxID=2975601 RepID=A0AA49FMC9_9PROT|nr:MAG: tRNA (adenosine(37)-N6)-threonylcarbamoyltransferase complex dimerization subunit type 1 TsaB [Candidatus Nitricoxidivorans perseverans]
MNLLALETSTRRLSVALWRDGDLSERSEDMPNGGSERLLPWVNELLAEAGLRLSDLDGIAFGAGPGGFTGLRLAAGCVQGLAYGLDLPVLGVCTLETLAQQCGEGKVFACLDARMSEVYSAAYVDGIEALPPSVGSAGSVAAPPGGGWTGAGDGFAVHGDALAARLGDSMIACRPDVFPTAAAVARLAAPRFERGEGARGADMAAPLYVRDKVALTTAERLARGGVR